MKALLLIVTLAACSVQAVELDTNVLINPTVEQCNQLIDSTEAQADIRISAVVQAALYYNAQEWRLYEHYRSIAETHWQIENKLASMFYSSDCVEVLKHGK